MPLLPRKGALAIAAVIDIAVNARGRPVAAKALASRHRLPPRHLEPVLQALVRHGILKGTRGPRGGYELARERSEEHTSELQSRGHLVCRLLLEKKNCQRPVCRFQGAMVPGWTRKYLLGKYRP